MKSGSFAESVGIAVCMACAGGVAQATLSDWQSDETVLRLVVAGAGLAYLLYLLMHSRRTGGPGSLLAAGLLASTANWLLAPPLALYLIMQAGLLWLARSLYRATTTGSLVMDGVVIGAALAAAAWAANRTGSLLLALWCFFLLLACSTLLPAPSAQNNRPPGRQPGADADFWRAYRNAEEALRKLGAL